MPTEPRIYKWPAYKVYARASLREGDSWAEVPWLDCVRIVEAASPAISQGTFVFRAGSVLRPGEADFVEVQPADVLGKFLRVDLLPDDAEENDEPLRTFILRAESEQRSVGVPDGDGANLPVTQFILAVGLEDELDRETIVGGFFLDRTVSEDEAVELMSPTVFNQASQINLCRIGNKSADPISVPDLPASVAEREAYAFEAAPREDGSPSDVWSVADILEYLLAFYVRSIDVAPSYSTESGTGDPNDPNNYEPGPHEQMATALSRIEPLAMSLEGLTVSQAINRLIRPESGLGWRVRPTPNQTELSGPVELQLHIFPINGEAIELHEATLPANENTIDIDALGDESVLDCLPEDDRADTVDQVLVLGERVLSCFTVSFKDGTLEEDWTDSEEEEYDQIAGAEIAAEPDPSIEDSNVTDLDGLGHVYSRYRLPLDWDGEAGDGEGGGKTLVNPKLATDGEITEDSAGLNRVRQGFEEQLPLESPGRPDDPDFLASGDRVYVKGFVMVQFPLPDADDEGESGDSEDDAGSASIRRYGYVEKVSGRIALPAGNQIPTPRGNVYFPPSRHAVQVEFSAPHTMANSPNWTKAKPDYITDGTAHNNVPGENHPEPATYAYEEVLATVALRTDQRLFATRSTGTTDTPRRLVIEVPDAQLWLVAPGTVTGLQYDGSLRRYAGEQKVRDDTPRLTNVAKLAIAWYGRPRRSYQITFAGAKTGLALGQFARANLDSPSETVDLCATTIVWDFAGRTTTLVVRSRNLDFSEA